MIDNGRELSLLSETHGPADVPPHGCREHCGACCIAPSITTPIPGMPFGKPAGIPCVQLLPDYRCALFGRSERPKVCVSLRPSAEMCGQSPRDATAHLQWLEAVTQPSIASVL